jgi:hypothetical protein
MIINTFIVGDVSKFISNYIDPNILGNKITKSKVYYIPHNASNEKSKISKKISSSSE